MIYRIILILLFITIYSCEDNEKVNIPDIVYQSTDDIFTMESDGSNKKNLTNTISTYESHAQFSTDGENIFFISFENGKSDLYEMDIDGGNKKQLSNLGTVSNYSISQTNRILLAKHTENFPLLYILDLISLDIQSLPELNANRFQISPDGLSILYDSYVSDNSEIMIYDIENDVKTNLTNNPSNDTDPQFSYNGTMVTFSSNRDGDDEIYRFDLNGGNITQLTINNALDIIPVFSPLGDQILFYSDRDSIREPGLPSNNVYLYSMSTNGLSQKKITSKYYISNFQVSPANKEIVYVYLSDIFISDIDGNNEVRLTNNNKNDQPSFHPSF